MSDNNAHGEPAGEPVNSRAPARRLDLGENTMKKSPISNVRAILDFLRRCVFVLIGAPILSWGQGYTITTLAGGGYSTASGIPATQAAVSPNGVAVDSAGNVYLTNFVSQYEAWVVSKVSPSGAITTIAGDPALGVGFSGDGGPATSATFGGLTGIAVDLQGNVYVVDVNNSRIRKISTSGIVTSVAGGGTTAAGLAEGIPAITALLPSMTGIAVDSAGNLYISISAIGGDSGGIRKVTTDGKINTVAGCGIGNCASTYFLTGATGDGGPATQAYISPNSVSVDSAGNLYIADAALSGTNRVRKVSTNGMISTVAGSAIGSYSGDGGPATSAGLNNPMGAVLDAAGNLYVDDSGDYRIRLVTADGNINTVAGTGARGSSTATPPSGVPATSASFGPTNGVAVGPTGKIYIADSYYGIRVLTPNAATTGGAAPSIKSNGIVSASSWIEIYGSNLASDSRGWAGSDFNGANAPTSLDGTSVTIGGKPAYVDYISPTQVNVQVPSGVGTGQQPVLITSAGGTSAPYSINVNTIQPGLLAPSSFVVSGKQYVAALFSDGVAYALPPGSIAGLTTRRAQPGDTITLYGIGFGAVTPNIPAGQVVSQANQLASNFQVSFGQTPAVVSYAGLAPNTIGLYQFNVVVPAIASNDFEPLTFTLQGTPGTQTLYISVQNGAINPTIQSLTLSASSVTGGGMVQGTVTLSSPAPAGGALISLMSSSASATVPANVTVPVGFTSATFTVTAASGSSAGTTTIGATYAGSSMSASLSITAATSGPNFSYLILEAASFQPTGFPSYYFDVTISPINGSATYTGTLTGSGPGPNYELSIAFANGTASNQTFSFTTLQPNSGFGSSVFVAGNNGYLISTASLTFTLTQTSLLGLAEGTFIGTLSFTATPLGTSGGAAITVSGPITGTCEGSLQNE